MAAGGISARCTSSETTCRPSSSAERSLKTVPDLTKGVRRPATIATRRPGREAMATSKEVGGIATVTSSVNRKHELVHVLVFEHDVVHEHEHVLGFGAQLQEIIPGVDAGVVAVGPF